MSDAGEYWVVDVWEDPDVETGSPGFRRRFEFKGDEAAARAWACWSDATKHGFASTAEAVRGKVRVGKT